MNRTSMLVLSSWMILAGTSTALAQVKTITAQAGNVWQPNELSATVGDVVEWKIGAGPHGVRITNWAAVKDLVEVETVAGQQPFNATTGRNDASTSTAGQLLVRLKLKGVPPAPGEITYNCIVHGVAMSGKVTVAAAVPAEPVAKTITAQAGNVWQPNELSATVGDVVEWKIGAGPHGVRITNWAAVKDLVEVETVAGQQPFNATTGRNDASTSTAGQLLVRLKLKGVPPAPGEITYNCIVHGVAMSGKVTVAAAVPAAKTITTLGTGFWEPNELTVTVGDVVEWKLGAVGAHSLRITNWDAVKDLVEVETVAGQLPFNATTGQNDASTSTAGQLLVRLKIKGVPPAPGEISYNCLVHGAATSGKVTVAVTDGGHGGEQDGANVEKVKEFFARFGAGDIPGVLNTMSEGIEWFIPGPAAIPYAGQRHGKEQVTNFFSAFSDAVEVQEFAPGSFVAQNGQVVVLGHEVLKVKTTASVVRNEWVMVFTIDQDRITRFRSYEDTAALVAAFGH